MTRFGTAEDMPSRFAIAKHKRAHFPVFLASLTIVNVAV
jgi:hypothetical protein